MENKEPLTHLMDFPFGPIHSSETPYLTINYVTPAHLLKESKCRALVQIVLCNSFLYTNNIQKYYSISRCVIFIIIVIAPTDIIRDCYKFNHR